MARILITGSNGQVGFELQRAIAPLGDVVAMDRSGLDLSDPNGSIEVLEQHQPNVIINAAAYTAVDKAENESDLARAVNTVAPGVISEWAARRNALFVHYSTDYVFDGTGENAYREDDPANPQSVYGVTKRDGEDAVRRAMSKHLILRTSWVVGAHGGNFLKTVLRLAQDRDTLRIVADQFGAPTSAELIADVTAQLVSRYLSSPESFTFGTYHLAASGETNWCEYARYILTLAEAKGLDLRARASDIQPIKSHEYPLPAKRPANSRLDCTKLATGYGLVLPDWREGVAHVFEQLHP
ncbi:dTDP-4-dehydrorhamnose reductase [Burkholderia sp. Ac-20344]|uniref:dTDP-4-dehydrorhamnose reductase n=1 Tax=Burkholderia sp. Ac-20344 TaxID=2703890 RepID=UPI00197C3AFC|nr:dTDP-4-dehydrorhamnose reductase [Burkholderia sp. Ac-20344]MBN3833353.1 dTDP-4-dehydrorhamnose reductase [Burkholderia sp. Ac-20344]